MEINKVNYVETAEKIIKELKEDGRGEIKVTTSQIRNILSLVLNISLQVTRNTDEKLNSEIKSRLQYLKMRMAYDSGRERNVKEFIERSKLMVYIDQIGDSKENLETYFRYMEALVAYHKFYDGKD